jgi:dTMP kinase
MTGRFISFEGVEGCGKTTQIKCLQAHLQSSGHQVLVTREPGGTPISESLRDILLDPDNTAMGSETELLLYLAARAQHVHEKIRPAMEDGAVVLCDRFADSTTAYQGAGRGISPATLRPLHEIATAGLWPDLTVVFDLPAKEGLSRARNRGRSDRIEQESLDFHERVRAGFLSLAEKEPSRIKIVDASQSIEAAADAVRKIVDAALEESP